MALLRGSNSNSNSETRPLGAPSAGSSCLGPILHSRSLLPAAVRSTAGPCLHGVLASPQTDLPQGSQVILGRTVHRNKPPPPAPLPPCTSPDCFSWAFVPGKKHHNLPVSVPSVPPEAGTEACRCIYREQLLPHRSQKPRRQRGQCLPLPQIIQSSRNER